MNTKLFDQLFANGLISAISYARIKLKQEKKLLSIYWEIKTILYLGVLLLSAGLGILVYKNINTIGHQVILLFIALVCAGSFFYCFKYKLPFSIGKVAAPNSFFDYILLLACCTFIIFIAYLQFQYNLFGNRYGLAGFFPMVLLFFSAYYFDHLGILTMAIVNLAAWLGITVTPMQILTSNDFNSSTIIFTGLALGILLVLLAWATGKRNIKEHFELTYSNFGTHIILISCLAAMFHFSAFYMGWFLLLTGMVYFFYRKAINDKSFYFILIITLYAYIGISYVVLNLLEYIVRFDMVSLYSGAFYFIISGIGLVLFLIRTNNKIKTA
ncbi:MAG: DUF2157 domain-containing protein [Ferruginibacter sp.]